MSEAKPETGRLDPEKTPVREQLGAASLIRTMRESGNKYNLRVVAATLRPQRSRAVELSSRLGSYPNSQGTDMDEVSGDTVD